jgi:hypothetical protein
MARPTNKWSSIMNSIRTESTEIRAMTGDEIDGVAGGTMAHTVLRTVGTVVTALGDALGDLVRPKFPIKLDLSGSLKAGEQLGRGAKGPQ